jgi:hypothetical protein
VDAPNQSKCKSIGIKFEIRIPSHINMLSK